MTLATLSDTTKQAFKGSVKTQGSSVHWGDLPSYEHVLLLQGPVGPFFAKLGRYWKNRGAVVKKINFNSGDDWFYPPTDGYTTSYRHRLDYWAAFIQSYLSENKIQAIFLFGAKRKIHLPIRALCKIYGIDLWMLEEGYYRPGYYTLERDGVNAQSPLAQLDLQAMINTGAPIEEPLPTRFASYRHMAFHALIYWGANILKAFSYPNYDHHRELNLAQAYFWTKSYARHFKYRITEKLIKKKLLNKTYLGKESQEYFLLPLQVHDDSQMTHNSHYASVENVIEEVMNSFHKHLLQLNNNSLSQEVLLIIKHHPMNRGHKNYAAFITSLARSLGIERHIVYVHDITLPSLLPNIKGCIVVNSTLGLQALFHGVPVINLSASFYDKPGLTYQQGLDQFWSNPGTVNPQTARQFRQYVIQHSQVAGCLYDPRYQIK